MERMTTAIHSGEVPVNAYWSGDERLTIVAPMPGMAPADISIVIKGRAVTLQGRLRGPGQIQTKRHLLREWTVGPYRRELSLPTFVDVTRANATYANGILTVMLPAADEPTSGKVPLREVGTAKGQAVGARGHVRRSRRGKEAGANTALSRERRVQRAQ
jgi:HSP20 family protein